MKTEQKLTLVFKKRFQQAGEFMPYLNVEVMSTNLMGLFMNSNSNKFLSF